MLKIKTMSNTYPSTVLRRLVLIVFVASAFFLTNCSNLVSSLDQYSGETLYESAVESDGDLLSFAPEIHTEVYEHLQTEEEERKFEAFQKDLITKLVRENPGFVDDFREKLHSDDRDEINEALTNAGALLEKELQAFTGESEITPENVVNAVLERYEDG